MFTQGVWPTVRVGPTGSEDGVHVGGWPHVSEPKCAEEGLLVEGRPHGGCQA